MATSSKKGAGARTQKDTDRALVELREFGLAYPGAHTKSPWPGHLDLAVKDKTFAYLSIEGEPLGISCKLPDSSAAALMLEFVTPTAYGLGKSGWVSAKFPAGEEIPVEMLKAWIDESYRSQAPKKLVAELDGKTAAPTAAAKKAVVKKAAAKTAVKKVPAKAAAAKKPATKAVASKPAATKKPTSKAAKTARK